MKVVFLDVDGVIASVSDIGNFSDEKLKLLKRLIEETEAKIVLSSTWRKYREELPDNDLNPYNHLSDKLAEFDLEIYDITPIKRAKSKSKEVVLPSGVKIVNYFYDPYSIKSGEIKEWLDSNEVESFVILDDEDYNFNYFSLDDNFVKIHPSNGLENEDIEKAINILNKSIVKKR